MHFMKLWKKLFSNLVQQSNIAVRLFLELVNLQSDTFFSTSHFVTAEGQLVVLKNGVAKSTDMQYTNVINC